MNFTFLKTSGTMANEDLSYQTSPENRTQTVLQKQFLKTSALAAILSLTLGGDVLGSSAGGSPLTDVLDDGEDVSKSGTPLPPHLDAAVQTAFSPGTPPMTPGKTSDRGHARMEPRALFRGDAETFDLSAFEQKGITVISSGALSNDAIFGDFKAQGGVITRTGQHITSLLEHFVDIEPVPLAAADTPVPDSEDKHSIWHSQKRSVAEKTCKAYFYLRVTKKSDVEISDELFGLLCLATESNNIFGYFLRTQIRALVFLFDDRSKLLVKVDELDEHISVLSQQLAAISKHSQAHTHFVDSDLDRHEDLTGHGAGAGPMHSAPKSGDLVLQIQQEDPVMTGPSKKPTEGTPLLSDNPIVDEEAQNSSGVSSKSFLETKKWWVISTALKIGIGAGLASAGWVAFWKLGYLT